MPEPIDTTNASPGSPAWWFARLMPKLGAQRERAERLDAYFTNEAAIPLHASHAVRESYRRLMHFARTNFAELVVEAVRERMTPAGFRTGASTDVTGDAEAWRIWQANSLDADSPLIFRSSLSMADAYVIVGGVDAEIDAPLITPEDPREVIVEADPRRRRKSVAALKVIREGDRDVAWLYLPGVVYRAERRAENLDGTTSSISYTTDGGWQWISTGRLPFPVVPVVRFPNRPNLRGESLGEFETHLPILDRINYDVLQRLEIVTLQAFRQRAVKGAPQVDSRGNEIDYDSIFSMQPGAIWTLPGTVDLWESGQVDLGPIHTSSRDDIQDLAAVTRTPLFYLTPDATNGSAEGASLAREGLVFKTYDRIREAGESLEQVMSLAFLFAGDTERAARPDLEVLWDAPERFSLAERYDAASKAQAAGVPWEAVMRDVLQFSPQEIERMRTERAGDALLASLAVPQTPGQGAAPIAAGASGNGPS